MITDTRLHSTGGPDQADRRMMKAWLSDHPGGAVVLRATHLSLVAHRHDRRHIACGPIAVVPVAQADTVKAAA
ncbi:hypothetical protein [Streptomyces sp. T028]|uniref:hypothetical protein n=1 Tax=Streptomyces sp. T028 TaxID=3394379 RepID=UPI003A892C1F